MTRFTVLSSSYVLYLSLLLSCSKVILACENTPIKQWRKWALYQVHGSLQAVCPENSAQAAFLHAHCPSSVLNICPGAWKWLYRHGPEPCVRKDLRVRIPSSAFTNYPVCADYSSNQGRQRTVPCLPPLLYCLGCGKSLSNCGLTRVVSILLFVVLRYSHI